jgi:hypothetical protein
MEHNLTLVDKLGEYSWEGGHGLFLRSSVSISPGDTINFGYGALEVTAVFENRHNMTVARVNATPKS